MKSILAGLVGAILMMTVMTAPSFAQTAVTCDKDYTVAAGDWLSKIANTFLGDATAFHAIAAQTNLKSETDFSYATVVNSDSIEVGWKLCIPSADTAKNLTWNSATPGLDKTSLYNATYSSELVPNGKVTVKDGKFSAPAAPNTPLMTELDLTGQAGYGDLNGTPSAAVVTVSTGGGSGFFYILSLMQVQDGKPVEVATTGTGDRSPVLAVVIQNNQLVVDYITQGPDQPFCCGTLRVMDTYSLDAGKLKQVSHKELGNLGPNGETPGAPVLIGVTWKWQGSTYKDGTKATPADSTKYKIQFDADNKVAIKADCNSGGGDYTATATTLKFSPLISTLIACPEGSLGTEFMRDLQNAAGYHFDGDSLVIDMSDGGTMRLSK